MCVQSFIIQVCSLVIQAVIAIGTITVAVLAIWGQWIRSKLAPPKLSIQPHNLRGIVTRFTDGPRVIYYHLKVINHRSWVSAKNCRILLRSIYRQGPNRQFQPVPLPVPPQFVWSPAPVTPPLITLTRGEIIDFGRLTENATRFEPVLYWYPNNFQGYVEQNDVVRYCLEIVADGYTSKRYHVFEVAWNGEWSENLDEMAKNLIIREITQTESRVQKDNEGGGYQLG